MDIGFLGLGAMGRPMALNLAKAGHHVVAWNRSPAVGIVNVELGASPADVAAATRVTVVMVSDEPAVREVIFGVRGWVEGAHAADVLMLSATVGPAAARSIGAELVSRGFQMIDAPVSGSVGPAEQGSLMILAGGDGRLLDELDPVFSPLASAVVRAGPIGAGSALKLSVNAILVSIVAAAGEALTWLVDTEPEVNISDIAPALERLSPLVAKRASALVTDPSPGGFSVRHATKDVGLAVDAMAPAAVLEAALRTARQAMEDGLTDCDVAALGSVARSQRSR
ncbi:MAG: NAD(P)-dependent oxidoreductase [Dehalococcoidia bacterium]